MYVSLGQGYASPGECISNVDCASGKVCDDGVCVTSIVLPTIVITGSPPRPASKSTSPKSSAIGAKINLPFILIAAAIAGGAAYYVGSKK